MNALLNCCSSFACVSATPNASTAASPIAASGATSASATSASPPSAKPMMACARLDSPLLLAAGLLAMCHAPLSGSPVRLPCQAPLSGSPVRLPCQAPPCARCAAASGLLTFPAVAALLLGLLALTPGLALDVAPLKASDHTWANLPVTESSSAAMASKITSTTRLAFDFSMTAPRLLAHHLPRLTHGVMDGQAHEYRADEGDASRQHIAHRRAVLS